MNLVLIGYRAAGKTTVGRRLSASLGRVFVDTDDLIEERQGTQIGEIVRFHGWDYFRAIEKKIVSNVSNHDNLVIAAGGGAVLENENVKALKEMVLSFGLEQMPRFSITVWPKTLVPSQEGPA